MTRSEWRLWTPFWTWMVLILKRENHYDRFVQSLSLRLRRFALHLLALAGKEKGRALAYILCTFE
jgi:hypothetical protein